MIGASASPMRPTPTPAAPRPVGFKQVVQGLVTGGGYSATPKLLISLCNRVTVTERPTCKRNHAERSADFAYTREVGYTVTRLQPNRIVAYINGLSQSGCNRRCNPVTGAAAVVSPLAGRRICGTTAPIAALILSATAAARESERTEPGLRQRGNGEGKALHPVNLGASCYPCVTRGDLSASLRREYPRFSHAYRCIGHQITNQVHVAAARSTPASPLRGSCRYRVAELADGGADRLLTLAAVRRLDAVSAWPLHAGSTRCQPGRSRRKARHLATSRGDPPVSPPIAAVFPCRCAFWPYREFSDFQRSRTGEAGCGEAGADGPRVEEEENEDGG